MIVDGDGGDEDTGLQVHARGGLGSEGTSALHLVMGAGDGDG